LESSANTGRPARRRAAEGRLKCPRRFVGRPGNEDATRGRVASLRFLRCGGATTSPWEKPVAKSQHRDSRGRAQAESRRAAETVADLGLAMERAVHQDAEDRRDILFRIGVVRRFLANMEALIRWGVDLDECCDLVTLPAIEEVLVEHMWQRYQAAVAYRLRAEGSA
jgi:hypothetical protein